uniref:Uncharacterized protein n=1 Tax=Wuhan astro-like virus TaxID=2116423 RepID=A0A2P1GMA9_9VIRU|nr:hypothetical protein [Wuhan astro-like virus]
MEISGLFAALLILIIGFSVILNLWLLFSPEPVIPVVNLVALDHNYYLERVRERQIQQRAVAHDHQYARWARRHPALEQLWALPAAVYRVNNPRRMPRVLRGQPEEGDPSRFAVVRPFGS